MLKSWGARVSITAWSWRHEIAKFCQVDFCDLDPFFIFNKCLQLLEPTDPKYQAIPHSIELFLCVAEHISGYLEERTVTDRFFYYYFFILC